MKKLAATLLTLLYFYTVTLSSAPPASAAWYNPTTEEFYGKVYGTNPVSSNDEIFGERYTFAQVNWIVNSLAIIFAPPNMTPTQFLDIIRGIIASLVAGTQPTFQQYAQLGVPGILMGAINETYTNPPASGIKYVSDTLAKFDPAPPVYAQGYGYKSLEIAQTLWKASRNMAYLLMIVLLVVSGFMVMFRVKINPQTAVTLQLMIPKIIITLLLVTFSYAIAGFVIDLIYVVITFIISMLAMPGIAVITDAPRAIRFFTGGYIGPIVYFIAPWIMIAFLGAVGGGLIGLVGGPLGALITGAIVPIISLIVMIFLVWTLFKIWWLLLKTYIVLLFSIIVGPWQIMLGLLPGQSGFGPWLRNIIANASVFVAVPIMFLINMLFWKPGFGLDALAGLFSPVGVVLPSTGVSPGLPFVNGGGILNLALGYAVLALTPKIAEIIRDALKVPPFKYGTAFGEALGPVTMGGRAGLQYGSNWMGGYAEKQGWDKMGALGKAGQVARQMGILTGTVKS